MPAADVLASHTGPFPLVYEGDPQARLFRAKAIDGVFLCYTRVAHDGVSTAKHFARVVAGDQFVFDRLGQAEPAARNRAGSNSGSDDERSVSDAEDD